MGPVASSSAVTDHGASNVLPSAMYEGISDDETGSLPSSQANFSLPMDDRMWKKFYGKTILRIRWWFDRRGCGSRFLLETVLDNLPPSDSESMVEPVNMMFGNNITFSGPTSYSSEHLKKKVRNHHVLERNTVTSCNDILRCWSRTSSPPIYFWHVT